MKPLFYIIFFSFFLSGCSSMFFNKEPLNEPIAVFDEFWNYYNENYSVFDERNVDWTEMYNNYRPMVDENTTDDELFEIFTSMLTPLNDGHVMLIAEGRELFSSNKYYNLHIDDSLFNKDVIRNNYLDAGYADDDGFLFGTINNNISYLHLPFIGDNMPIINDVIDNFPNTNGLIIDLRHNGGGDFTWAVTEFQRLTNTKRHVFTSRTKSGPQPDDFTDWFDWYVEPAGEYYNKPIVLLTDRYTISAGERATMILMSLPNVTSIGDTTNSSHSTMVTYQLANEWYFTLSVQEVLLPDGISYEGIGLAPDIFIKNEMTDIENGIDAVLEEAISQF